MLYVDEEIFIDTNECFFFHTAEKSTNRMLLPFQNSLVVLLKCGVSFGSSSLLSFLREVSLLGEYLFLLLIKGKSE